MKAILTLAMIVGTMFLHAGGKGVIPPVAPPIEIPDDKPNCGCPCK